MFQYSFITENTQRIFKSESTLSLQACTEVFFKTQPYSVTYHQPKSGLLYTLQFNHSIKLDNLVLFEFLLVDSDNWHGSFFLLFPFGTATIGLSESVHFVLTGS